jgi:glycosyltransferase involved in cell wall biosynthesis
MAEIRLAWLSSHPVQYQAPLLRAIARIPGIDLTALFFSDFSSRNYVDREMGRAVTWDVPLLDGYKHEFIQTQKQVRDGITFWHPPIQRLSGILTKNRFDAVIVQGWNHHGYVEGVWAAKKAGLKVLLRCEATDHVSGATGLKRILRNGVVNFVLGRVDRCLAIGTRNREFYAAHGVSQERIGLMPYCVDNDHFRDMAQTADTQALRAHIGLEAGRPIILYASKLTARKYADLLLEGYQQLPEPRPYLLFVGDGELRPELERKVAAHQLNDVRFLGFRNQSELPGLYALADIFALPSVNETWGLVVNEAMNAGCAILVTDQVGSAADLVQSGVNGIVIPPKDANAIAVALSHMLHEQRYLGMGLSSQKIIAKWGIPETVSGLKLTLNELISNARY